MCSAPDKTCSRLAEKDAEIKRLRQRIALLEKALFGPGSERLVGPGEAHPGQQVFDELLAELAELNAELEPTEQPTPEKKGEIDGRKRKKRRNLTELASAADLPVERVDIEPPEADRFDPVTGDPLVRMEGDKVLRLAYRPGEYFLKELHYVKYMNPGRPPAGVVQAPAPDAAVLGGSYDESFMAKVAYDKCAKHLPLYRQVEELANLGLDIPRQTLSRIYMQCADTLRPLWKLMKDRVIGCGIIFTDDTPVKMLEKGRGKTVTGRMWTYIAGGKSPPYKVFEFTRDRSKKRPKQFLGDFRGYIHADAYQGYDDLFEQDDVHECACWMHVRRKFVEATDAPLELRQEVLRTIRHLYMYERFIWRTDVKGFTDQQRCDLALKIRREKSAPLIDRLFKRVTNAALSREVLPGSDFDSAIGYMLNLGDALKTFIGNPHLKPDNGESERAIRPLAIGRKNWLFAGSEKGGDATGVLLSIIQTCRGMGVEPFSYLEDVLRRISGHPANRLHELLPDQWKKQDA